MKTTKTLTLKTRYGQTCDVCFGHNTYVTGGRLAVWLYYWNTEFGGWKPYIDLTVNLVNEPSSGEDCAYIDTNNFPDATEFLRVNKLAKLTGMLGFSGRRVYPEYQFDLNKIKEYTLIMED